MFKQLDGQFEDPDQKEFELRMSKTILAMPDEVQDRFKALKVLYVSSISTHSKRTKNVSSTRRMRSSIASSSSSMTSFTRRSTSRGILSSLERRHPLMS